MGNNRRAVVIRLAVLGTGVPGGWLLGTNSSAASVAFPFSSLRAGVDQDTVSAIVKFRPSVVQINVPPRRARGAGFGNDHREPWSFVTNDHVVTGAKCLQVELFDGTKPLVQMAGRDPLDDLAVVKITPPQHMALMRIL